MTAGRKLVALIPARSGSKRIPNKNIYNLGGHPLLAYSIYQAKESNIFSDVICVTDCVNYANIAKSYGAEVPALRPAEISGDFSPDIEWVRWMLGILSRAGKQYEFFSILRPTSPFRGISSILNAWKIISEDPSADSVRAVEKCAQHPGKMWVKQGDRISPLLPFSINGTPWHSNQYGILPEVFVQNASLEIARVSTTVDKNSISGDKILPYFSNEYEGFDINSWLDLALAEELLRLGKVALPCLGGGKL